MTLLTVFLLPLAAFLVEGVWSDAIHHARHEAGFLSNTFSPAGVSQCTSLMHFQIDWTTLFIYLAFREQALLETPRKGVTVLLTLVSKVLSAS